MKKIITIILAAMFAGASFNLVAQDKKGKGDSMKKAAKKGDSKKAAKKGD